MNIGMVHISDIHLKSNQENSIKKKVERLYDAISSEIYDLEEIFLLITGDIAFSGKEKEFDIGFDLISGIIENLEQKFNKRINVLSIPGNHDCDFSGNLSVRTLILESLDIETINDEEVINEICKPLESYYSFEKVLLESSPPIFSDKLFKQYKFKYNNYSIHFNCFNTPWVSLQQEKPGTMIFPIEVYKEYIEQSADLSISLLHHPSHWLEPNQKRLFDNLLKLNSDIIISGHEHTLTNTRNDDFNENDTILFEASALQTGNPDESSFSVIKINLEKSVLSKNDYHWESKLYSKKESIIDQEINISKTNKRNEFQLKNDFSIWLNDLGIPLKHPRVDEILLTDFYVFPDAKFIKYEEQSMSNKETNINLEKIINFKDYKKVLIAGQENYGKTSFCKKVFESSFRKGYTPVYISGNLINKSGIKDFMKTLNRQFLSQYEKKSTDEFEQKNKNKIVLIIDDLDKTALNTNHRNILMNHVNEVFPNIIVTASELTKFSGFVSDLDYIDDSFEDFVKLEMLAFGHRLRGELIEKWNRIGDLRYQEESTLIKSIDKSEKIVSTIIGNNFIPSVPFFILVILQTGESEQSNLSESAYGYYYEYLISQSLMNIKLKNEDIDAFNNYLSHLAYSYFKDKTTEKTRRELTDFHQSYCSEYDLTKDFSDYEKKLLSASILAKVDSGYSFKYKYIFYYFVAKYLSRKIMEKDEEIEKTVVDMCKKLYIEEYSNIIMFLSHLSKSTLILNSVLDSAKFILNEIEPAKLEDDVQTLNELIVSIPKMLIENKGALENRQDRQVAIDEIEKGREETASDKVIILDEEYDNYEQFDIISKINWATKTLEIMGQILKNYYGSTTADKKLLLGEEAFLLSMRALNTFLKSFSENKDNILREMERVLKEKDIVDTVKGENISRKFIFNLISAISHYFIKKVSSTVGTINLEETFLKVLDKNDMISVKLIDLAIKLDHGHAIPFKDIENFIKDLPNTNHLALHILRVLAVEHMYMFHVEFRDRHKIIDMLDINERTKQRIALDGPKKLN